MFMHCSYTVHALFIGLTTTLLRKNILKMGPMALFTHLKVILLQCFQFLVFNKISCIQMNPYPFLNHQVKFSLSDIKDSSNSNLF